MNWKAQIGERVNLRVTPKASSNRIKADTDENGDLLLRVYVTVPPEDGKANAAVIKLLAKELGIAKSSLEIVSGLTSKNKVISIT